MNINLKSSNFHSFLLASYAKFGKMSYLCTPNKGVLCICKIQKRAEVRSFPYRYLIIALKQYRLYHSNDTTLLAWLQVSLFPWLAIPVKRVIDTWS